ncbi:MFS transporter [Melghirimyces profundicolus]|nr:MFS transporter [Melghirimyces profundicolus]
MSTNTHVQAEEPLSRAWRMLGILLGAQVAVAFLGRGLAPVGPLIEADLSITKAQVGMLPAALFLGQSLFNLPAGFLVDRYGTRWMLLILTLAAAAGFLLAAWAPYFGWLLFFVVVGGFAYGGMHPVTNRGIIYWFPHQSRGTAMGVKQTGITAGSGLAALILLPAAMAWGWREALSVSALATGAVGWAAYVFYRDSRAANRRREGGYRSFFRGVRLLASDRSLWKLSLSTVGLNMGNLVLSTYLVFFAHEHLGFSLYLSGLCLVISEAAGSAGRIAWGWVSDRLWNGRRVAVLMIITVFTLGCSLTAALLPSEVPYVVFLLLVAVFGFCICGFNGIWMNAATESVPREQAGLASGFSVTIGSWGVVLGPPLFGWIVDRGGYTPAWLVLAGIMAVVLLLLAGIREEDK